MLLETNVKLKKLIHQKSKKAVIKPPNCVSHILSHFEKLLHFFLKRGLTVIGKTQFGKKLFKSTNKYLFIF